MAIVRMQKVAILAPRVLEEQLLERLQDEGVVQVSEATTGQSVDHTEVNFRIAELEFAITTLLGFASKNTTALAARKPAIEEIFSAASSCDVRGITQELHDLEAADTRLEREIQEARTLMDQLHPWRDFPEPLHIPQNTAFARRIFGSIPVQKLESLQAAVTQHLPRSDVRSFGSTVTEVYVTATLWKEDARQFEEMATAHGWTTIQLPALAGTAASLLQEAAAREQSLLQQKEKNTARRRALSVELPALMRVRIFVQWLHSKQAVRESVMATKATVMLLGWMAKNRLSVLADRLHQVSPAVVILPVEPEQGEEIPVLLQNSKLLTPFESVTTLYGLPMSSEMDPTAPLSPFFALFFALCLTDAGYGLAIALIFGTYLFLTRARIDEAKLPWLLFIGGVAAFIAGIPFGGWFGLSPGELPTWLHWARVPVGDGYWFRGQVWNLGEQSGVTFLQNLSLVLGLTHLFFGMFLAGWHKWMHGKRMQAFWEHFTSHLLFGSVLVFVFTPEAYKNIALYTIYFCIGLTVWGKGYGSPWYLRPLMGALGFVNMCIGFLSNVLSYLRILALGLVTGAIALAVNQVAVQMSKLLPVWWLSIPVMILIAIGGHTVSIALNTLGSFIHSGRLQFIEFFGQFFEGGGKPFAPFSRPTKSS